jgi:hypothetical protein
VACVALALAAAVAPAAPAHATATVTRSVAGDDWSLPAGPGVPNSGLFSEGDNVRGDRLIDLRGFDLTWRQIQPRAGAFDAGSTGSAQGMDLPSFRRQNADPRPFWTRLFASATTWAPRWLPRACRYKPVGPDDDGQMHVPIWDPCVWDKVRDAWRTLMIGQGLRSDPRLRFVYAPGAFTWVEFDYEMVDLGVRRNGLTFAAYRAWHVQMLRDLVAIMNGENDDPADDFAYKLVFTGEDYPFSERFRDRVALFARDAVEAGMGIRNGITELFNFHLNEVPAYGTTIGPDGHLVTNDDWQLFDGRRVAAAENECYDDCGFHSPDPLYAVKLSNLKALQLRLNWIYVVPQRRGFGGSRLRQLAAHWRWVRRELGHRPEDAPDAWVALRDAEDVYWRERGGKRWRGFPFVRNLERWVVQRDVAPDGIPRRGTLARRGDPAPGNGRAYESLRTDADRGRTALYFDVDARFMGPTASAPIEVKVTYRDVARTAWRLEYRAAGGVTASTPAVLGSADGTGRPRTVTFTITDPSFDGGLSGATDIAVRALRGNVEASFLRVVKTG